MRRLNRCIVRKLILGRGVVQDYALSLPDDVAKERLREFGKRQERLREDHLDRVAARPKVKEAMKAEGLLK